MCPAAGPLAPGRRPTVVDAAFRAARRMPLLSTVFAERAQYAAELARLRAATPQEPPLYPPGHFYSPVPDLDDIRRRDATVFADRQEFPGIDLRTDAQLALAAELGPIVRDHPFTTEPTPGLRYCFRNDYFGYGDGIVLHGLLRLWRPARLVEVGSGFSSALILDTNDRYLDRSMQCTFIDPYADRLRSLLRPEDYAYATVLEKTAQEIPLETFLELQAGDVLFIDSSHVSKIGSDVNYLLLDVLPQLPAGVWVHVHDIVWPFEYSREWVFEGRAWNEAYLLRALLINNPHLEIVWFTNQLNAHHRDEVAQVLPVWATDPGTSMWLRTC